MGGGEDQKNNTKTTQITHTQPHGRNIINVERNPRENSVMEVEGGKGPRPIASKRLELERTTTKMWPWMEPYEIIPKSYFQQRKGNRGRERAVTMFER